MKQNRAILFFFIYLLSISGLMVQLHLCHDQVAKWDLKLFTAEENALVDCCCEEEELDNYNHISFDTCSDEEDCCDNQEIVADFEQSYLPENPINFNIDWFTSAQIAKIINATQLYTNIDTYLSDITINGPPESLALQGVPIYIKFQKLIIYS